MHKRDENKLTMYEGMMILLQANSAKVQTIGGFSESAAEFATIVSGIKAKSTEVDEAMAGKLTAKYNAEDALVASLLPICSALYLLGRKLKSTEIQELAKTTESKLRAMRDTEIATYGTAIADLATTNAQAISAYGITAEKIADLKTKALAYATAIGERESSIADRKGARESLSELFAKADEIINEEFENFMELLRPTETEFYNKFFSARLVKDTGVRHEKPAPAAPTAAVPQNTTKH